MNSTGSSSFSSSSGDAVTVVKWSDFQCGACAQAAPVVKQLKEIYGDDIEVIYKHFPIGSFPGSEKIAEASECARDQGKFWEYHDLVFASSNARDISVLKQFAVQLNLDTAQFNTCLDSGAKQAVVAKDRADGIAFGVKATPTFSVGGERVEGVRPLANFRQLIDAKLAEGGSAAVVKDDPQIDLIVISDPTCIVCNADGIVQVISNELFPTSQVTRLDASDAQAQELISSLGLEVLPAYLFSPNVAEANNYFEVSDAMYQAGEFLAISPAALIRSMSMKFVDSPAVEGRPVLGNPDAPVTMFEWSDFTCPFCERHHTQTHKRLVSEYVESGKLKIVRLHYTWNREPRATQSRNAALASECAFEQGKFWEYHDALYLEQSYDTTVLNRIATQIGLDEAQFSECLSSQKYLPVIQSDMALAQKYLTMGTPGFIINGVSVSGAQDYSVFAQVIDAN